MTKDNTTEDLTKEIMRLNGLLKVKDDILEMVHANVDQLAIDVRKWMPTAILKGVEAVIPEELERMLGAWRFMAETGTYVVPSRRDERGVIRGWVLRTIDGCNVSHEFSREIERPIEEGTGWPPWKTPLEAIEAYKAWVES